MFNVFCKEIFSIILQLWCTRPKFDDLDNKRTWGSFCPLIIYFKFCWTKSRHDWSLWSGKGDPRSSKTSFLSEITEALTFTWKRSSETLCTNLWWISFCFCLFLCCILFILSYIPYSKFHLRTGRKPFHYKVNSLMHIHVRIFLFLFHTLHVTTPISPGCLRPSTKIKINYTIYSLHLVLLYANLYKPLCSFSAMVNWGLWCVLESGVFRGAKA